MYLLAYAFCLCLTPIAIVLALLARFVPKPIDIGIGPEPIVSHIYHKQALQSYGYTVETFVSEVYFITNDFDIRGDQWFQWFPRRGRKFFTLLGSYAYVLFRYKCLYIYFNGGPLGFLPVLRQLEPLLYRIASVKVVVMAYGSDVQDMSRTSNLAFRHALAMDYPKHHLRRHQIARKVDMWTRHANHIISGCDWVEYMHHWDTLMIAHFSIDVEQWKATGELPDPTKPLRIMHAPNHTTIKGTQFFVDAVRELQEEGLPVELVMRQMVPNAQIRDLMASVDVVADQLIIGWYAMFAIEAMSMQKPVLCYLRDDFYDLYVTAGLLKPGEIPIINCTPRTVKEKIRDLILHRDQLLDLGERSRQYVVKHHSLEAIGTVFDRINRSIGVLPSQATLKKNNEA